jgi:hypothetical protein
MLLLQLGVTVITLLRTFLLVNVTVNAESVHFLVAFLSHVAGCAFLLTIVIVLLVMALYAFQPLLLMDIMRKLYNAHLILQGRTIGSGSELGSLGNGYHVRILVS